VSTASCFLIDSAEAFNLHVDAPAEKEEAIYGAGLNTHPSGIEVLLLRPSMP
jgi:hypothetical protein